LAASRSVVIALRRRAEVDASSSQGLAALQDLLHARLRKCVALLSKVLAEDDPEAVHDFRVWSRRAQEVVVTLFGKPLPPEAGTIVRVLRRARRSLGICRDCDVLKELLERKARRVRNPAERRTWEMIRQYALNRHEREMRRVVRKLANRKLFTLSRRARALTEQAAQRGDLQPAALEAMLVSSVRTGYTEWRGALSRACDTFLPADIHAFRIRTKRLRYRIELVRDLGDGPAEAALTSLKGLQEGLGQWHDHSQLGRLAGEALADPRFLVEQAQVAGIVLRKLARDHSLQEERIRRLLLNTRDGAEGSALHNWISRFCSEASPQPGEHPGLQ
jgi:CHAD domain-containing protein